MLERNEVLQEDGIEKVWRREMQIMLMLNVKAEMEILADREGGVKGWVEEKLLENCNSLHANDALLEMYQLSEVTLDEKDLPGSQVDEGFMLDAHETSDVQTIGGDPASLQADEDSDMTLDEDDLPGLQADEDFMLDTDEMTDMPTVGGGSSGLQTDENLLDTYEMVDITPADESSANFEWDDEL